MRRFVERKMALSDHRTLGYIATLAAEGWGVAYENDKSAYDGFSLQAAHVHRTDLSGPWQKHK